MFQVLNKSDYNSTSGNYTITTVGDYCIWYQYPYYNEPYYNIKLRQVENGWVLLKDGKEYIISDKKEVLKYL